ncbi:ArgE/DapE family deacylase [Acidimicrobiia bacterium EGI L10123]|uniref:ArgE/DapE family deacylase n=1 Tax=Salinilacustrithrix flava TaxID=2957203 RepID=UPI003D7C21D7|nr:ArgE/DapE family deacylase [Acidimicrobiia bacterium EGI L10123]
MQDDQAAVLDRLEELVPTMIQDVRDLVCVPSVGGTDAENEAQEAMARRFERGGLEVDHWRIDLDATTSHPDFPGAEVERREAWGLVGRLPGTGDGPTLLFDGHVDVVPIGDPDAWSDDPFSGALRDGRIHGRGSADMKAGLLAAHWAVQAVRAADVALRGDVLLAPVQGEEDGGLGTFALLQRGWSADACVIPEPTDLDVIPANAGALTFRLTIRGRATHAARRAEGVSAVDKLVPVLAALAELERQRHEQVDPLAARWELAHPLSLGTVRAGDWASSVPDRLVAEGRIGVAIGEPVEDARASLEAAVAAACDDDPWLRDHPVEVEWWGGQFASGRIAPGSDLVDEVQRAHRAAGGSPDQEVYGAPYGSDLRLLTGLGGIPTVQYGPGDVQLAHGPHESVPVDEVVTAARAFALLVLDVCGRAE